MHVTVTVALATLGGVTTIEMILLCCAAQGGQGKYNSDYWMSLLRGAVTGIITLTFANGNTALDFQAADKA